MSIGPDNPRRVGGRYWDGYWHREYTVLAIVDFDDWRGRLITVPLRRALRLARPAVHAG